MGSSLASSAVKSSFYVVRMHQLYDLFKSRLILDLAAPKTS
jgi:hypothetical protein